MNEALERLASLIGALCDVHSRDEFHDWKRSNESVISEALQYFPRADMPPAIQLVSPSFHPSLPLILLNYTPAAGVSLHHYSNGWTPSLRLCRGIIFDRSGNLVAYPFPKFFNFGEHGGDFGDGPCEVTEKLDGHLIICCRYGHRVVLTTRGDFQSPTAQLANEIGQELASSWLELDLRDGTALLELIAPETHVGVDYGERRSLVLIGMYDNRSGADLSHAELCKAADALGVEVVPKVEMSRPQLVAVPDTVESAREGYVARWPDGHRVKLKYKAYIERIKAERSVRRSDPRPARGRDVSIQIDAPWLRHPVR